MDIKNLKKIHFIGIGGIGVSAAAKYAHNNGTEISGSDEAENEITKNLEKNYRAKIILSHGSDNVGDDIDLVVYSPAISPGNVEIVKARKLQIPVMSYPEFLGEITRDKCTIAVSGTNGKTTTAAMIAEVMRVLGTDPSVIVGGIMKNVGSNFLHGSSKHFIIEACEYKDSFLGICHDIMVVTNIKPDHLEHFHDIGGIQESFLKFLKNKKGNGVLVCNTKLPELKPIVHSADCFGMTIIDTNRYNPLVVDKDSPEHNRENILSALGVIDTLSLDTKKAAEYLLNSFVGVKRRMDIYGVTAGGTLVIDDYAHNPDGLRFLILGLRKKYPDKKIVMIFEPHLYSRTENFLKEFVDELLAVDELYLLPIYRSREANQPDKDWILAEAMIERYPGFLLRTVKDYGEAVDIFRAGDYGSEHIFVTVGAGTVYKIAEKIVE